MEPVAEAALRDALAQAYAVDADIISLPEFSEVVARVKVANGQVDAASVQSAVAEMQRRKPNLFAPWNTLGPDAFLEREAAFRKGLSQSRPFTPSDAIPEGFDFSALSEAEFEKADRFMRGASNDATVFRRNGGTS